MKGAGIGRAIITELKWCQSMVNKRTRQFIYIAIVQTCKGGAWIDTHSENKAVTGWKNRVRDFMRDLVKNEGGILRDIMR